MVLTGCRGCRHEDPKDQAQREAEEKARLEQERKKEPIEVAELRVQPPDTSSVVGYVKPGHWTAATQTMKANYDDFVGEAAVTIVGTQSQAPVPLDRTLFWLSATRPAVLAKGRPKGVESLFLVPQVRTAIEIRNSLRERRGGLVFQQRTPLRKMPSYQYHFVVLAREPTRYTYLKTVDAVRVPYDGESEWDETEDILHYQVRQPDATRTIPLPDNSLAWTCIAYLLWDEVDPQLFTDQQEQALLDWLHWGGQLIVNGPDSLDALQNSFLREYLPATSGGSRTIVAADLAEWNRVWKFDSGQPLAPTTPWSGIRLQLSPEANWVRSTGELLAERDVGRGRIVVTSMQLAERDLINWNPGFESWLNACLLRRPPRRYQAGFFDGVTQLWADPELDDRRLDAKLTSSLRYFARDPGIETNYQRVAAEMAQGNFFGVYGGSPPEPVYEMKPPQDAGGVGAWTDFSATANAARQVLLDAAGVEIPGAGFVVFCLAVYLAVLVPFNWLFFRALGRVEWAWVAAPILAIAGTWGVINQAQLDIGFVRSQTEIGVLELQPGYARGHLTRYTGLYTSLSTTYDFQFEDPTAVAAPFATRTEKEELLAGQTRNEVMFEKYDRVWLRGLPLASNSTVLVHSEQMFPLDGAIQIGTSSRGERQLINRSQLDLKGVGIVHRATAEEEASGSAPLEGMWVGNLRANASTPVAFTRILLGKDELPFAAQREAEARLDGAGRLDFDPLLAIAYDRKYLAPGETRLVARLDGILPGQEIEPSASQTSGTVLVVAHLGYGPRTEPRPDRNARVDVVKDEKRSEDDQSF
jgi:hypothetical protein